MRLLEMSNGANDCTLCVVSTAKGFAMHDRQQGPCDPSQVTKEESVVCAGMHLQASWAAQCNGAGHQMAQWAAFRVAALCWLGALALLDSS